MSTVVTPGQHILIGSPAGLWLITPHSLVPALHPSGPGKAPVCEKRANPFLHSKQYFMHYTAVSTHF